MAGLTTMFAALLALMAVADTAAAVVFVAVLVTMAVQPTIKWWWARRDGVSARGVQV